MTPIDDPGRDRSALARLVQRAMDSRQPRPWTVADLARESGLSYNSLRAWLQPGGVRSLPRPENLDKVADALHLSRAEVRKAAQRAAGYVVEQAEPGGDPAVQAFIATYEHLTPEARERIMQTVQTLLTDPNLFPRQDDE